MLSIVYYDETSVAYLLLTVGYCDRQYEVPKWLLKAAFRGPKVAA
jgi:hypothetical protein